MKALAARLSCVHSTPLCSEYFPVLSFFSGSLSQTLALSNQALDLPLCQQPASFPGLLEGVKQQPPVRLFSCSRPVP